MSEKQAPRVIGNHILLRVRTEAGDAVALMPLSRAVFVSGSEQAEACVVVTKDDGGSDLVLHSIEEIAAAIEAAGGRS